MTVTKSNMNIGVGQIQINAVDIGGSAKGITIKREVTYFDFSCDQAKGTLKKVATYVKMTVAFSILEMALANLRAVWFLPSALLVSSSITMTDGQDADAPIIITTPGIEGTTLTWNFPTCTGLATGAFAASRTAAHEVGAEFEVIPAVGSGANPTLTFGTVRQA